MFCETMIFCWKIAPLNITLFDWYIYKQSHIIIFNFYKRPINVPKSCLHISLLRLRFNWNMILHTKWIHCWMNCYFWYWIINVTEHSNSRKKRVIISHIFNKYSAVYRNTTYKLCYFSIFVHSFFFSFGIVFVSEF